MELRTIWTPYLQAEGLDGLLLLLVCGTLYAHRRRAYFLYGTLAWLMFILWRLLHDLSLDSASGWGGTALSYIAAVCGWWHIGLWLLSLLHLRHVYSTEPTSAGASASMRRVALPCLAAATGLALLVRALMPPHAAQGIVSVAMAAVYGGSAAWLVARWWRTGLLGARMLSGALALWALVRLYGAFLDSSAEPPPLSVLSSALLDFLMQTVTVVALIVVLLGDENVLLHETDRRLAEAEDRFRLLFEHGGVGMALLSPDGDFLQVNPALVQMLGYPSAELVGRHVTDVMHGDDRSSSTNHLQQAANAPQYEKEKRFLHREGQTVWAQIKRVPIHDAHGAIRYHATIFVDVTQRKQAEQALAASEKQLRLRFQQAFDGVCLWSASGTFLDANPALCRLLGVERAELLGRNVAEVAADAEVIRDHLYSVLESAGNRCEIRLLSRGGSPVDVEVNSASLEVEGQRLILGICRDISARKRAEAALHQADRALREERDFITQILQTADALVLVLDPQGRILRFNNKCQSVSGRGEDEVRGRVFWECLLPEHVIERARDDFRKLLAAPDSNLTQLFENPWKTRDDEERVISWRCSLIRDEQGRTRHVIAIGLDVTEQRRLQEQVIRARKMETLGTLVGGIAHDFNNLLTAILGNLDMVRNDLSQLRVVDRPDSSAARQELEAPPQPAIRNPKSEIELCVRDAERAAQRCARMTGRLLTFSRGRVGSMQTLALDQLLNETAGALQHDSPGIQIEVRTPPGSWLVTADVAQLQELLLNLTTNAREAMPDGGTLTLGLTHRTFTAEDCVAQLDTRPGSFIELSVRDTGHGMTPAVRERLFEPFFTTKRPGQGFGMGLPVVFGIVKGHKGWISVESQPGAGTMFHIYLPAAEALRLTPPPVPPVTAAVAGGHILVVDDEPMVRYLARIVLERAGFTVVTADDGEQALDIYRREGSAIDLVLLDYSMPRMNGVQLLKELQQLDPEVCAVFSSGYHTDHDVDQLLAAGARAFVPKPYRPNDLVQAIREVLAQKKK
ncbi:MAG TPA: PAS domain S-box protein [Gemmataceae bacterium]|jgi:PAS domain S-box-containing protein